jgi:hypothetical protein
MSPPSDDPGLPITISASASSIAVIVFAAYVLGGYRLLVTAEKALRPALVLVAVMVVTAAAFLAAARHEAQEREDAWDRYDRWLEQQSSPRGAQ